MIYIDLPAKERHSLAFYLAMEEYIARHFPQNEYFFMWQVDPSVIFGRHQDVEAEVNAEYCHQHNIKIYRRKSGGGCVYADMSNVMLSYICADDNTTKTFSHYLQLIVETLKDMGIDATYTTNNDIMIGDKKVSGNAFYHIPGRSIVHGTLLYDTCMDNMIGSITPSEEKLVKHGVQSVRQRLCLLKDITSLSLEEVKNFIRKKLTQSSVTLTQRDVETIREEERKLLNPEWIYGHQPTH